MLDASTELLIIIYTTSKMAYCLSHLTEDEHNDISYILLGIIIGLPLSNE